MSLESKIPAFSMWKMFNDTIPALFEIEFSEACVERLTNVVKSEEFSNIFVFKDNSDLPLTEYEAIASKYDAFTVWLVGKLFYLLQCHKLSRMHDIIIDAQLRILHLLAASRPQLYNTLGVQYCLAISFLLNNLDISNSTKLFVANQDKELLGALDLSPSLLEVKSRQESISLLKKLIQISEPFFMSKMSTYSVDKNFLDGLKDLLRIIREAEYSLKIDALWVFIRLLKKTDLESQQHLTGTVEEYIFYFNRIVSHYFSNCYIKTRADETVLEEVMLDFLSLPKSIDKTHVASSVLFKTRFQKELESSNVFSQLELKSADVMKECQQHLKIDVIFDDLFERNKTVLLQIVKNEVIKEISNESSEHSETWNSFLVQLESRLLQKQCTNICVINQQLECLNETLKILLQIKLILKNHRKEITLHFLSDDCECILNKLEQHCKNCRTSVDKPARMLLSNLLSATTNPHYSSIVGGLLVDPRNYASRNYPNLQKCLVENLHSESVLQSLICWVNILAGDIYSLHCKAQMERICSMIIEKLLKSRNDNESVVKVLSVFILLLDLFDNSISLLKDYVLPLFSSESKAILSELLSITPTIICMLSNPYKKIVTWNNDKNYLNISITCTVCENKKPEKESYEIFCSQIQNQNLKPTLIHNFAKFCDTKVIEQNKHIIKFLSSLAKHIEPNSSYVFGLCLKLVGCKSKDVRDGFADVAGDFVLNSLENPLLSEEIKKDFIETLHLTLKGYVKNSLQYADYDLQETLLETLDNLKHIAIDQLKLYIIKLSFYFIIIPNSKYVYLAINAVGDMTNRQRALYSKYKKEICQHVINLCAVSKVLAGKDLSTSLDNVSVLLGFNRTKDFIVEDGQYLLPYLVALSITTPEISELIRDMAQLSRTDVADLLSKKYGYIFLYSFLNESEENFTRAMNFLEQETRVKGQILRKRHFRIILNELLLNFDQHRDRVLLALTLLAKEDTESPSSYKDIPNYLQPKFLGVLQYFDRKFAEKHSDKGNVLRCLEKIFRFVGPTCLAPLRFKIIAMLQTALSLNYESFPELSCDVWVAFVESCDLESLGPQLALIVVSVLPLLKILPHRCNSILRYLVVQNETKLKNHICDLFFLLNMEVGADILTVVTRHVPSYETTSLKDLIKFFLKYCNQEATDVKIHSLRHVKTALKRNRKELDQLIFAYNGLDPVIVELLDVLILSCRDKADALKVMCGKVIGELGAIEPSRLPRRYTQTKETFTFFITEDSFITNVLNVLIKALQSEKNTENMDRYAVAMQELLKTYEVSPDPSSSRHRIWTQFPENLQELMMPYLSSRYTILPDETSGISPIFGSKLGSNFKSWIFNWTASLVECLPEEKKTVFQSFFPCIKRDQRILMELLPYVLLHCILECSDEDVEKAHLEIRTVVDASCKYMADEDSFQDNILHAMNNSSKDANSNECAKIVFVLIDFLERWVREWEWQKVKSNEHKDGHIKIQNFVRKFSKSQLAHCNYQCGEYPRALMYIEEYITENPNSVADNLAFLSQLYAKLDEPDGVTGIMALQQNEPSLNQRILTLEVSGKLSDAAACYERIQYPLKSYHLKGLIQCYLDLDNVNTALNFAQGAMERQPEFECMLMEMQAEPLWRLGKYDDLSELLKQNQLSNNKSWGVQIGKALIHLKNRETNDFISVLDNIRHQQVELLAASSLEEGIYQHGYMCITKLHALSELEKLESIIQKLSVENDKSIVSETLRQLQFEWNSRIKVVQESIRMTEPILCLRRVILEQAQSLLSNVAEAPFKIGELLGECWLTSAKNARCTGILQQAFTYTLKAEKYNPPRLFLEKAKLHWLREETEHSLSTLVRGVEKITGGQQTKLLTNLSLENRKICAEAKLLIAVYNDQTSNLDTESNIMCYKDAVEVYREWEKSILFLGQYYDKIFGTYNDEEKDAKGSELQIHMINCYGKSLLFGSQYVYQSMPRLLSIWFDYGTRLLEVTNSTIREERKTNLLKMTKLIDGFLDRLPAYIFLTAFSQLISRICHPQREVYIELKSIIIKLLLQFPQQVLWMIITVSKSSYAVRTKRCAEIFQDPRVKAPQLIKLVKDFTMLAEKLIELCNKEIPEGVSSVTVSSLLRTLPRMLTKGDFSQILMPTYKFRKLILPNPNFENGTYNPFPNNFVYIIGIEDEIAILPSLQRPRRITLKGSDGKKYIQMLKPKDDLRKDFRLMEFNDVVNQLLSHESESRQRRLNIRLYSVAPLNEECGLIEWVPNLVGLRPILVSIYKQKGIFMRPKEIKERCCSLRDPLAKKKGIFTDIFLARHPPVLGEWFRFTFPNAQSWLTARTAFIRTTAVMSMAGYILGLGDRHGENILLDSTNGDVVHVDFNCLFNKGETFEWPEIVPFRLTQNMVAAMGPLGTEGAFWKSCVCTLRVLRKNTNTLMSIVTPFVYDPLVSWHKNVLPLQSASNSERTNEQALDHVRNIELRLQGLVKLRGSRSTTLSVEGQVNKLIKEATNVDNLCQMYIGWGPYL